MATSNTTPIVIPQPFAAQATSENINVIPNGATGTNGASFQEGFPAITRMPVIENPLPTQVSGLPPKQQDFNGIFNAVSQHNFFAQNGGLYSFNQAVSDAIGGYPQGALLWVIIGGKPTAVYSLVENNTFNFLTNPEYLDGVHWAFIDTGLPTGTIITWAANNVPDGYLLCNGAAISRATYARLFNVIGTTWGAGDGNTTFNLPNLIDRLPVMRTGATVGEERDGQVPDHYHNYSQAASDSGFGYAGVGYFANNNLKTLTVTDSNNIQVQPYAAGIYTPNSRLVLPTSRCCYYLIKY